MSKYINCELVGYRIKEFIRGDNKCWHVFMLERQSYRSWWRPWSRIEETFIAQYKTLEEAEQSISQPTGYYGSDYLYNKQGKFTPGS